MTWTPVSALTVDAGPDASGAVGANLPLSGSATASHVDDVVAARRCAVHDRRPVGAEHHGQLHRSG